MKLEEHMARWKAHYEWMVHLLLSSVESLLDIGCGTCFELDCIISFDPSTTSPLKGKPHCYDQGYKMIQS
ncbi:MAG TPA: hypothetical protein PK830_05690 [Candidatus Atribacteria bacterium]|nr:hypothetical protein [Candidatus Atribacteria bacterium]HPT78575.1 hypothetical protein [Candidatus Atribacteria bacterium]